MKKLLIPIVFTLLLFGCGSSVENEPVEENPFLETLHPKKKQAELIVGGLYWFKFDTTYYIQKIIAIDDFAVHVLTYETSFKVKPTQISSDSFKIMGPLSPIDKKGFLLVNPELLKVEDVKDSELERYKFYLEQMSK